MKHLKSYLKITFGCLLYAIGFNWFFTPNQIAYAGVTGIAQMIHALLGAPSIGVLIILINIPLFLLGWYFLGGKTLVNSLFAMMLSSIFIDLVNAWHSFAPMEHILASIFGGVLLGISSGIILAEGATTGGTDLAARLVQVKLNWLPVGRLLLALDLLVIISNALVFQRLESALYGIVALFISSALIDKVLYGMDNALIAYIISEKDKEITAAIFEQLDRGATIIATKGAYSCNERNMIMCAIADRQIVSLKNIVKDIDPQAFLVVGDAHEVMGEGFREKRR